MIDLFELRGVCGQRADVTTAGEIVRKMEENFTQAERVWVVDREMVSEANIAFIVAHYAYEMTDRAAVNVDTVLKVSGPASLN